MYPLISRFDILATLILSRVCPTTNLILPARDHDGARLTGLLSIVSRFTLVLATMPSKTVALLLETFTETPEISSEECSAIASIRFLDMVCDILHYTGKLSVPEDCLDPGYVSTQVAVSRALKIGPGGPVVDLSSRIPSVGNQIKELVELTQSNMWKSQRPFLDIDPNFQGESKWWDALPASLLARAKTKSDEFAAPISSAAHEDIQLEYDRIGVPVCCLGSCNMCAAQKMTPNHGPLHIYLSAKEQHDLDCLVDSCTTELLSEQDCPSLDDVRARVEAAVSKQMDFDSAGTCLLCIRRDVSAIILSISAMLSNCELQVERGSVLPPPFCNQFNIPGGYASEFCAVDCGRVFGNINIVGGQCGKLRCQPFTKKIGNELVNTWRFDQSQIKFGQDRLN